LLIATGFAATIGLVAITRKTGYRQKSNTKSSLWFWIFCLQNAG